MAFFLSSAPPSRQDSGSNYPPALVVGSDTPDWATPGPPLNGLRPSLFPVEDAIAVGVSISSPSAPTPPPSAPPAEKQVKLQVGPENAAQLEQRMGHLVVGTAMTQQQRGAYASPAAQGVTQQTPQVGNVRDEKWYMPWVSSVCTAIKNVNNWANIIYLIGIKGSKRNGFTMHEWPEMIKDVQKMLTQERLGGEDTWDKVRDARIAADEVQEYVNKAKENVFVIIASCPSDKFDYVEGLAKKNRNVYMAFATGQDLYAGV